METFLWKGKDVVDVFMAQKPIKQLSIQFLILMLIDRHIDCIITFVC